MIKLSAPRVVSFSLEYFDVYWSVEPTTEDLQNWDFYVERGETELADMAEIAGPLIDTFFLRDNSVHTLTPFRTWFYRIRARNRITNEEVITPAASSAGGLDLVGREIVRNEEVLRKQYTGIRCWLFARKTFGQRCPACWDRVMGRPLTDSCQVCWGTGFSGGFHRPVSFWGEPSMTQTGVQRTIEDIQSVNYDSMRLSPSPNVAPMDIIVDAMNRRFEVTSVGGPRRLAVRIRQQLELVPIAPGHIYSQIPLQVDTETVLLRPPAMYSNPQNIDAATAITPEMVIPTWRRGVV